MVREFIEPFVVSWTKTFVCSTGYLTNIEKIRECLQSLCKLNRLYALPMISILYIWPSGRSFLLNLGRPLKLFLEKVQWAALEATGRNPNTLSSAANISACYALIIPMPDKKSTKN